MAVVLEKETTEKTWQTACIKDVCELIVDCVNKTAPAVDYETEFKMIRTTNVKNGWVNLEQVKYVTEETFDKWNRRATPKVGDVILTREAPLGEVGILRSSDKVFLGQRLVLYRANSELLDKHFLLYALMSHEVQAQIKSFGSGSTVEHMRVPDCEKINLPYPPVETQRKIGAILSAYDDLIANNLRRIKRLETMAQALYREWFVHFRYPGHEQVPLVDSPLGPIPEAWEVETYETIFDIKYGKNLPTTKLIEAGEYPVYGAGGIIGYYSECLWKAKVCLVACRGNGSGTVSRTREAAFITNNSLLMIPREGYQYWHYSFIEQQLRHTNIMGVLSGSAQPQITINGISTVQMICPEKSLVEKFQNISSHFSELIDSLYQRNQNLHQTRDLLLPRLISGQLDVSELEVV